MKKFYTIKKVNKGRITDLEDMGLQEKLDFLRENELKFMQKKEALAEHEKTWKTNGLNSLDYETLSTEPCSDGPENCMIIQVHLGEMGNKLNVIPEEGSALKTPEELFEQAELQTAPEDKKSTPSQQFDKLIKKYFDNTYSVNANPNLNHELEVRFGTKGIKQLTKNDYDNVVKVLKSFGFTTFNPSGIFSLRARCEFLDSKTGRFKMSDVRTEIDGLRAIEKICKSNDIKTVYKEEPRSIKFVHKRPFITPDKEVLRPVNFDDFNFRATYSLEETATKNIENFVIDNWRKSKKEFRYYKSAFHLRHRLNIQWYCRHKYC